MNSIDLALSWAAEIRNRRIDLQVHSPAASPKSAISGQRLGHFEALKSAKMRTDIQGSFRGPIRFQTARFVHFLSIN